MVVVLFTSFRHTRVVTVGDTALTSRRCRLLAGVGVTATTPIGAALGVVTRISLKEEEEVGLVVVVPSGRRNHLSAGTYIIQGRLAAEEETTGAGEEGDEEVVAAVPGMNTTIVAGTTGPGRYTRAFKKSAMKTTITVIAEVEAAAEGREVKTRTIEVVRRNRALIFGQGTEGTTTAIARELERGPATAQSGETPEGGDHTEVGHRRRCREATGERTAGRRRLEESRWIQSRRGTQLVAVVFKRKRSGETCWQERAATAGKKEAAAAIAAITAAQMRARAVDYSIRTASGPTRLFLPGNVCLLTDNRPLAITLPQFPHNGAAAAAAVMTWPDASRGG